MKNIGFLQRAAASVLSLVLAVGGIPSSVFAADTSEAKVSFQIVQQITGDTPTEKTDFSYEITTDEADGILPDSCTAAVTINGSETSGKLDGITDLENLEGLLAGPASFEIVYTTPGTYSYTIRQQDTPDGYTHDESVYHIEVTVEYDVMGKLRATYSGYKDNSTGKCTNFVFVNEYTEPQTEPPKVTMTFEKTDAETGEQISGAVLRVVDENSAIVDEWTSNGSIHTIEDQLIEGETYRLVEISAPAGYKYARDIEFTAAQDAKVVMADEAKPKDQDETGSITVTKQLMCNGDIIGARDQVFYVALYEDPECTYRVTEIKPLDFVMTSEVTAVFDGLEAGKTYYLGEADVNGINLVSGVVDDGTLFYTDFIQGQAVTAAAGADESDIKFLNEFYEIPYEFYIEGRLIITKKLEDADGNADESFETFYAGVFEDPECTILCEQVSVNLVELSLNGASEARATVRMVLSDTETINLYVTEVDANGIPVSQDPDFAYNVTVAGSSVSLNIDNTTAETTIINQELPEETEPESSPEPAPRTETESEPQTETESALQTESETESESQTELQTEPQTELQTEPQTSPQTEKQTASQTEKQTTTSVKTGDETPVRLYVTLLAAAAVILTASLVFKRRRNKRS